MIGFFCSMVRKYKRKTERGLRTLDLIKDAVKKVLSGEKIRKVSRETGIDKIKQTYRDMQKKSATMDL